MSFTRRKFLAAFGAFLAVPFSFSFASSKQEREHLIEVMHTYRDGTKGCLRWDNGKYVSVRYQLRTLPDYIPEKDFERIDAELVEGDWYGYGSMDDVNPIYLDGRAIAKVESVTFSGVSA
jgi:hypothetical protein